MNRHRGFAVACDSLLRVFTTFGLENYIDDQTT